MKNTTGGLFIDNTANISLRVNDGEDGVQINANGSAELYYNGVKKFETAAQTQFMYGNLELTDGYSLYIDNGFNNATSQVQNVGTNGSSDLRFKTTPNGGSLTTALTLDDSQNATFAGDVDLADSKKIKLGNSDDLQIYHDGSNSYLTNTFATGDLILDSAQNFYIKHSGEVQIQCTNDGAVNLYYDGSKKLETTAGGIAMAGVENAGAQIKVGAGNDLQLEHDGTNTYISNTTGYLAVQSDDLRLTAKSGGEPYLKGAVNGAVELYYDNVKTFETTTNGAIVYGTEGANSAVHIYADEGDDDPDKWRIVAEYDNSHLWIQNYAGGSWESNIKCVGNGNVELYYDSSKKFETTSNGISVGSITLDSGFNNIGLPDGGQVRFGAGEDLRIYHDGSNSYIKDVGTGILQLNTNYLQVKNADDNEFILQASQNGAVSLRYDNSTKLETTSGGVNVTGAITVNGSALSSAPTIELTANGAIAVNKPVIVNSSGQAEEAAITAPSAGSGAEATTGSTSGTRVVGNGANQYIIIWIDGNIKARVATVSGTTISYGTECTLESGVSGSWREFDACYLPGKDAYALVYDESAGGQGIHTKCFTVSGTTITAGTGYHLNNNNENNFGIAAITRSGATGYSDGVYCLVHNDSSSSRYFIRTIQPASTITNAPTAKGMSYIGLSSVSDCKVAYEENVDKFFGVFKKGADVRCTTWDINVDYNVSRDNSGITILSNMTGTNEGQNIAVVWDPSSSKMIFAYNTTSNYNGYIRTIARVDSNNFSLGTAANLSTNKQYIYPAEYNGKLYVSYTDSSTSLGDGDLKMREMTISGTTISLGTETTVTTDNHMQGTCIGGSGGVFIGYRNYGSSNRPTGYFYQGTAGNITSENFVGFSSAAISNGASGTINVTGNTTTQSSLTPGQKYYVQQSGGLSTSPDDPSVEAGVALSSTKLLIKG